MREEEEEEEEEEDGGPADSKPGSTEPNFSLRASWLRLLLHMLLLLPLPVIEQIAAVFIISHQTCKQPNFPSVKCCRLGTRVCYVSLIPLK